MHKFDTEKLSVLSMQDAISVIRLPAGELEHFHFLGFALPMAESSMHMCVPSHAIAALGRVIKYE